MLDLWNKVYQEFGKFNSEECSYGQSVKYESSFVFAFYVDEQHLDMYTYKVETQQRNPIYILYIYYHYLTGITNQLAQIEN